MYRPSPPHTRYYFPHLSALRLAGAEPRFVDARPPPFGDDRDGGWWRAALAALRAELRPCDGDAAVAAARRRAPKMVVLTTPGNPTGAAWPRAAVRAAAALCRDAGAWLVIDEVCARASLLSCRCERHRDTET